MKLNQVFSALILALFLFGNHAAKGQDAFLGEVRIFAGNYAPTNWALCQGQLLPIASNAALFTIIGTTYGGDGRTTFALPDLRGRIPVGAGQGPGLSSYGIGTTGGVESITLTPGQLPAHSHLSHGVQTWNTGGQPSQTPTAGNTSFYRVGNAPLEKSAQLATTPTGQGQPINNVQPYVGLNYIICVNGVFPPRN